MTLQHKFLIVDDDEFLRRAARSMLKPFTDAPVLDAADGYAGLALLEAADIDIVFCDLSMPEMDGLAFLRHLGEAGHKASVVVVSGHDDALISSVEKMAQAYGVALLGAIKKPLTPDKIADMVARHEKRIAQGGPRKTQMPSFELADMMRGMQAGEFTAFYQPQIDFRTGALRGVEALARWRHPQHGVVAPGAFISALEKSGNIDELTFLMLAQSALTCRRMTESGMRLDFSVNLSLTSLGLPHLAEQMSDMVRAAGVEPSQMVLEVTESAAMTDLGHSLENLARLRLLGFRLSVDDYGTGHSNIQQISCINFQELKIDQSFVKGAMRDEGQRIIVRSSIDMAHQLGMSCVAEGVETAGHWQNMQGMGCDIAQGYYIAKPMDAAALAVFCARYAAGWTPAEAV